MRTILYWASAIVLIVLMYATRFDTLAREYLASAYVIRNLVMELVVGLLLVEGLPRELASRLRVPLPVAWLAGMIPLAIWYGPPLLLASLQNPGVRIVQALSWVIGGALLLLPLYSPARENRIRPVPHGLIYLAAALIFSTLVSLFIGFTHYGLYRAYLAPADTLHILDTLQQKFTLTPEMDRQTACLLLWVLSLFAWLWSAMLLFYRMYRTPETK